MKIEDPRLKYEIAINGIHFAKLLSLVERILDVDLGDGRFKMRAVEEYFKRWRPRS